MASWNLVPCLVALKSDISRIAVNRDRTSDGTIGDIAHQMTVSDHNPDEVSDALRRKDADSKNEVHAIDIDEDLREPGLTMEMVVQHILKRCRSGAEKRLTYIIYERRIWSASDGWKQRAYTGKNPHDKHAHFSASYDTAREASTADWHLEDIPMAMTPQDKADIRSIVRDEVAKGIDARIDEMLKLNPFATGGGVGSQIGAAVLTHGIPDADNEGKRSPAYVVLGNIDERTLGMTDGAEPTNT